MPYMILIRRGNLRWLWLALIIIIIDQLSKYWALHALTPYQATPVCAYFNWFLSFNKGAAFSFLNQNTVWQQYIFGGLATVISLFIIYWLARMSPVGTNWQASALALVMGGALGNLYDRLTLHYVVDFIQWYYQQWYWPTFNIADSAVCVGAVMLLIDVLKMKQPEKIQH